MGSCAGTVNQQKSPMRDRFRPLTQGVLKFNSEIQNIKLNYPIRSCHLKINVAGFHNYDTPTHIDLDGKHNWLRKISSQIESTESDLRDLYLTMVLFEENNQLANLKISLYDIITGPTHFDYQIGKGRISFDMTMAQIIQMEIQVHDLDCSVDQCIQDKAYVFNLRLVTRKLFFTTENSERFMNPAYQKGNSSSFGNMIEAMHRIQWSEENPKFNIELPLDELYSSSLQVCIWSMNKIPNDITSPYKASMRSLNELQKNTILEQTLFAEAYIGLNQLLTQELDVDPQIRIYKPKISKGLWIKGTKCGNLQIELEVQLPQYLKQQLVGLRTEKGCALGNTILSNQSVKEINDVVHKYDKLCELIFKLQNQTIDNLNRAQIILEAQIQADQLLQAVSKSHKEIGPRQFYYKNYEDLLRGQETFIKIADHLIRYVDKLDQSLRDRYYQVLDVVSTRGELRLNQLGYFDDCKTLNKKQLAFKNQICLNYQQFLYGTLNQILLKISSKTMCNHEKEFVERFLVRAFFRVPEFRTQFLQCIIHESDPLLHEWRGTAYGLEETQFIMNEQVTQIFDWQNYFYNYLSVPPNHQHITLILEDEWKLSIGKRNITFFFFVTEFCKYIQSIFQKEFIPWQYIPGYKTILKATLLELKLREQYTDFMIQTLLAVVVNTTLLNAIIMILFNKCQLFHSDAVVSTIDLIDQCLQQCTVMPTNFDYPFFLNGMRIILTESNHSFTIANCLHLIYTNFILFPIEFRKAIVDLIFNQLAYTLFLHWSKTVRTVFQNLLIYRIYHLHRNNRIQITDEEQFDQQYNIASRPKKMQSFYENRKEEKQLISDYIYLKYTRFIMNLEQAKFKLKEMSQYQDMTPIERMKMKLKKIKAHQRMSIKELVIQDESDLHRQDSIAQSEKKIQIIQKKNEFRNPAHRKTIVLTDQQYRYLQTALGEHSDLMKVYTKWRQQNITHSQNPGMSPEEKSQKYIEFPVPAIKIMQHMDLKEGKHDRD